MSQNRLSLRKRQLANLSSHIRSLSGVWSELSTSYKERLLNSLNRLHIELRRFVPFAEMKRLLAGVAILLGAAQAQETAAQNFAAPLANVAGLSLNGITIPEFADIDNDGDLDLFVSNYDYGLFTDIAFFENVGSATSPSWGAAQTNPFGFTPSGNAYTVSPTLIDIDGDGDLDLFTSEYDYAASGAVIVLRENTGTASAAQFGTAQVSPFGLTPSDADAQVPEFADVDGDGDYDLITLDYDSYGYFLRLWENTGTATAAAFVAPQPNPLSGILPFPGDYNFPSLGDLDYDGDLDMIIGSPNGSNLSFHENTGTSQAPIWDVNGTLNPFGLQANADYLAIPTIIDLDSDGDMDIVTGAYYTGLWYYENLDVAIGIDESHNEQFSLFPNPAEHNVSLDLSKVNNASIEILDAQGRIALTAQQNSTQMSLDVRTLSSGIYHVKVTSSDVILTQQLIIE